MESHQQRAIELLYEELSAEQLDDNSEWIQQYRTPDKAPAGEPVGGYCLPFFNGAINWLSRLFFR